MSLGLNSVRSAAGRRVTGRILENVTAPVNGAWYLLQGQGPVTVTVEGNFSGDVRVRVSNVEEMSNPGSLSNKPLLGVALTEAGWVSADGSFVWIAVEVVAVTSGTIDSVNVFAGQV